MDVIWDEDSKVWCGQGLGIQVLGLLRLMAYNLVSRLRCRYLRHTRPDQSREETMARMCVMVLFLLICQAGRDLFPHRQTTAGI